MSQTGLDRNHFDDIYENRNVIKEKSLVDNIRTEGEKKMDKFSYVSRIGQIYENTEITEGKKEIDMFSRASRTVQIYENKEIKVKSQKDIQEVNASDSEELELIIKRYKQILKSEQEIIIDDTSYTEVKSIKFDIEKGEFFEIVTYYGGDQKSKLIEIDRVTDLLVKVAKEILSLEKKKRAALNFLDS